MEDAIEAVESFRNDGEDLHVRFIGTVNGRQFVLNVQLEDTHAPCVREAMIVKILTLVIGQLKIGSVPDRTDLC